MTRSDNVSVLKLSLHGMTVGYLAGYQHGKNVFTFSEEFKTNRIERPTLGLVTHPNFPNADKVIKSGWVTQQKLSPLFSNMLPEGALRQLVSQQLKIHEDNEFTLFSHLAHNLPGALSATSVEAAEVPQQLLNKTSQLQPAPQQTNVGINSFSLAGVQMKFSMTNIDGRFNLQNSEHDGDWIIKTPSTAHRMVPLNEYTAMSLAGLAGVDIPEIKLVALNTLDNLPPLNLPDETYAYAIKRFDRNHTNRIHIEDFAQIFMVYPDKKYRAANYQTMGRILYTYSGDSVADVQQFVRRILVNILLANGDAHLKNWSLIYHNKITPRLSPAYDIVTTSVYLINETEFALKLGKNRHWYQASLADFEYFAEKSGVPWRTIQPILADTLERARSLWPDALTDSPMADDHKASLRDHWRKLHADFKIF